MIVYVLGHREDRYKSEGLVDVRTRRGYLVKQTRPLSDCDGPLTMCL